MSETYRTTDLYLAAYLLANGGTFVGFDRKADPNRTTFLIEADHAQALRDAYFRNAPVPARGFADAVNHLKSWLFL